MKTCNKVSAFALLIRHAAFSFGLMAGCLLTPQSVFATLVNVATTGSATQSTTLGGFPASQAINGLTSDFSHTDGSDAVPTWTLQMPHVRVSQVTLTNRADCCQGRLSDITIDVLNGNSTVGTSPILNPGNVDAPIPADVHSGPPSLSYNPAGVPLANKAIVTRSSNVFDDILQLAEVQVLADNVAQGKPAIQSLGYQGDSFPAGNATNGNLGDFTHTDSDSPNPFWRVDLGGGDQGHGFSIDSIVLRNRGDGCCQERLRDITVDLLAPDGTTVLATSGLLNPGNTLGSPKFLSVDMHQLFGHHMTGQFVRVSRLSSGGGDDGNVLALGEVQVFGISAVPEPTSCALLCCGIAALLTVARRHRR